jgi:AraC-like DNA-binding protein
VHWFQIATPLVWLFVPSTITLGLFFYRFNTIWLNKRIHIDRFLWIVPVLVLLVAVAIEISHVALPENLSIQSWRISFTEKTLRFLFPLFSGLLIILNFYKIRIAEKANRDAYTQRYLVNLNWCKLSLAFYTLFYFGVIISELSGPFVSEIIFNVSIFTLTFYLGYYQIKIIAQYLEDTKVIYNNASSESSQKPKSKFSSSELNDIFQKVEELITTEHLYLKPDLTIHELGIRLELNSKYLSQAINNQEDLNFNKYINKKRIAHAQELILDKSYKKYSIEGIAQESGFRSKSTFNTTFKSLVGLTPSEFKKNQS